MFRVLSLFLFLIVTSVHADDFPPSPRVMWGLGLSGQYQSSLGLIDPGFALMVDVTPLEIGYSVQGVVTVSAFGGGSETVLGLLLEKRVHLGQRFDVEIGVGPSLVKAANLINSSTSVGILTAGTFNYVFASYWGVYVEPSFQVLPRNEIELSWGATIGLTYSR